MADKLIEDIPFSILDLAPITEGNNASVTFKNSLRLAQRVEELGYNRYWLAEHHNMESVASSATSVLIGYIAGGTKKIRVGSGGIMLPNHAPLVVAEQFGTLASLYPGRIDLGLGRAPGTDQVTARALRRNYMESAQDFPDDVIALQNYFSPDNKNAKVRAIPGEGADIPIWILGSSTDSAQLAAHLGLPYAFASHFAPTHFLTAIELYRRNFRPSKYLTQPYVMACVNVIAADTNQEAERIATSFFQLATGIITGKRRPLQPPVESMDGLWGDYEEAAVRQMMKYTFIGDQKKISADLAYFQRHTQLDELMVTSHIYDPDARIHSYEILKGVQNQVLAAHSA
ncbi:LLM class flavin-dependent oxidoreductase [Dyadobacter sp. CY351]|uniref:LLM class flavin-dependent oxidoreductase n=1 Tax=Dyadobacter sp. CY351 TaxID=2909337 RepID=UPI001F2DE3E2|nr:LLM class flavin-dependent oxidoreductase [Dyadobacter sp. CY351]MCF2518471.1 LLM class flavin-dependent oxidoreductase [Dyadobacter sp. CY351]